MNGSIMAKKDKEYEVSDHQLSISSLGLLFKLFKENGIDPKYSARIAKIMAWATFTQPLTLLQRAYIYPKLQSVNFDRQPPVFVIGHWRSGTTHLHYLLSKDPQFGFLSNYQAYFMNMSFLTDGVMDKVLDYFMPATRPQDNIKMGAYQPAEEEQPLTNLTECSGMQTFFFPQNRSYFDKYNLFKDVSSKEKKNWQKNYSYMLKLISIANDNKPLILKNPHNTSRIKELLELYPTAKFIFIHRDPIDVYYSTRHLFNKMVKSQFLQDFSDDEISDLIIYFYRTTLQKYIADRSLVSKDHLVEISYSELEKDAIKTLEKVYNHLGFDGFEQAKNPMESYLAETTDYKKNRFEDISPNVLARIRDEWQFAFEEWNYPIPN